MNSKVLWMYERMMPFISTIYSKKTMAFLLAICMMFTSTGCGKVIFGNDIASRNLMDDLEDGTSLDIEIDFENSDTAMTTEEANAMFTDFAVRLFQKNMQQQVSSEKDAENMLVSPISVLMALSMTANGAKGDTLEQMEHTLGMSVEHLNEYAKDYLRKLPSEKNYKFTMANSIWFRDEENRLTVNADFLTKNKAYYHADVYESVFDATTVKDINSWIAENTDGLITKMLDEIPLDAVMYLINACVFDAKWQQEYNTSDIWTGDFYCADGTSQQVDMMHSDENDYLEDKNATGFIKYYEDEKYAFVALLPNKNVTLSEYVSSLTGEHLQEMLTNPTKTIVHATMPKFETEYQIELRKILKEMGMTDAFDISKADLSGIGTSTRGNLFVSSVLHKSFITVDELGTKAGAATVVEVMNECAPLEDMSKTVVLERPFLYMIVDCEYYQPLFMGTVEYIKP